MQIQQLTGKGKRENNQDVIRIERLFFGDSLFLIVDGMGGYEKGAEAAKIISESIFIFLNHIENITRDVIQQSMENANVAIKQFNEQSKIKSGATLAGIIITKDISHVFWMGDVKAYQINSEKVLFKTKSHRMINCFLDSNNTKEEESLQRYNHIVTRSISGRLSEFKIGYHAVPFSNMDLFILCSDGIHEIISIENLILYCKKENGLIELEKKYLNAFQDNYSIISISLKNTQVL